jgi:proline iminopeptidase
MVTRRWLLGCFAWWLGACSAPSEPGALVPPTADEDPALPQIRLEVAGHARAVHLETFGDSGNPLLLVLHGSLGDYRALRPFRVLADRYFVVMWDQRGNGLSERIEQDEYTWDSVVEEIDAVRERFAPGERATLLGHSFGGMYAALYTSRHPDRVEQLALLEPGGLNGRIFSETFDSIINVDLFDPGMNEMFWQNEVLAPSSHEAMDYRALMILLNGKQTNYFCDREHPPHYPVWRPGAYVEYLRGLRMGAANALGTPHFEFDFARGLDTFPRKVLIVAGTCSALGPEYQRRHHVPLFADAEVVTVPHAGHRLFVERFDEVLAAVQGYLDAPGVR